MIPGGFVFPAAGVVTEMLISIEESANDDIGAAGEEKWQAIVHHKTYLGYDSG